MFGIISLCIGVKGRQEVESPCFHSIFDRDKQLDSEHRERVCAGGFPSPVLSTLLVPSCA